MQQIHNRHFFSPRVETIRPRVRTRRRAFTLVELLVVIGIIAVLISLLLPALSKAREAGQRAQCLSNLHQVHIAFMMYANAHKGHVPIWCKDGCMQNDTFVQHNSSAAAFANDYQAGFLYFTQMIRDPRVLFCPSDNVMTYSAVQWNAPYQPGQSNPGAANGVRTSYAIRGETPDGRIATFSSGQKWDSATPGPDYSSFGGIWYGAYSDPHGLAGNYVPLQSAPLFSAYKSKMYYCDAFQGVFESSPNAELIIRRHRTAMNVLYADGSARTVQLAKLVEPIVKQMINNNSSVNNGLMHQIYTALDQQ